VKEWSVNKEDGISAQRNEKRYACCPELYPDVTFTIHMRRGSLFYVINLIAPCMSIFFRSSCSVLVLVLEVLVAVNASTRDVKVLRQAGLRPEFWSWFRSWSGGFGLSVSRTNVCARS